MPYSITTQDGITIQNIPDETPADAPELKQRVATIRAQMTQSKDSEPGYVASLAAGVGKGVGQTALGLQHYIGKGVQAVGDALAPAPTLSGLVAGQPKGMIQRAGDWLVNDAASGRAKLEGELKPYKEANPLTTGVGEVGGEVLATLPVGGALAAPIKAAARVSPALAPLADAVATAGMRAGGVTGWGGQALRAAGGAAVGGASASLVDPSSVGTGAAVGAVMPAVAQGVARVGGAVADGVRNAVRGQAARTGGEIGRALELNTPDAVQQAIAALRAGQQLVPGSTPTAAQVLGTPQAGILERVVSDTRGGSAIKDAYAAQNAARLAALEGVAPTAPAGYATARADTGTALQRYAQAEEAQATRAIRGQYGAIDPNGAEAIPLPVADMRAAANKFTGAGSVGDNSMPRQFAAKAEELSRPAGPAGPSMWGAGVPDLTRPAAWDEVLRMRSSLNEQWSKAREAGDKQAAAALDAQKTALDEAIRAHLGPEALAQWTEANASHAAKMDRFHAGPQASIFQVRNGAPAREGGEVASLFWGNRPGLAEDVQSLRKLIDDNPSLLGQFRSMVTTEGANTADAGGKLGTKFARWVDAMRPGLERAFQPDQVDMLTRIAQDIRRSEAAAAAGMSRGSNTYQNANNALKLGLLDSSAAKLAVDKIPFGGAGIDWLRTTMRDSKASRLAQALSDANAAADALATGGVQQPGAVSQLLASPAVQSLFYRVPAPALADRRSP